MEEQVVEDLIKLADHLDKRNLRNETNYVDRLIQKIGQLQGGGTPRPDSSVPPEAREPRERMPRNEPSSIRHGGISREEAGLPPVEVVEAGVADPKFAKELNGVLDGILAQAKTWEEYEDKTPGGDKVHDIWNKFVSSEENQSPKYTEDYFQFVKWYHSNSANNTYAKIQDSLNTEQMIRWLSPDETLSLLANLMNLDSMPSATTEEVVETVAEETPNGTTGDDPTQESPSLDMLTTLSSHLDYGGHHKEADYLDAIIRKIKV